MTPTPTPFREQPASTIVLQMCSTRAMTHAHRIRFHVKLQALRLLVMERRLEEDVDGGIRSTRCGTSHENSGGSTRYEWSHRFT